MMPHKARKRFGQNFLHDTAVLTQMANAIHPLTNERLVEIGPGQGALTDYLLPCCDQLDLVEIDRDLIAQLRIKYLDDTRVTLHAGDALKFDFTTFGTTRIYGNLPYNISTPLIFHLFSQVDHIQDMHFLLQKEVVLRLCAEPNDSNYGRLSVMTQFYCHTDNLFEVPPEAFDPIPKVQSAYIRLIPRKNRPAVNPDTLEAVVKAAFAFRRKTLSNCLKGLFTPAELTALHINPKARAQSLSCENFVRLAQHVNEC